MEQKLLNLENTAIDYDAKDFIVSSCNLEAYKAVTGSITWPYNHLLIIGEEGSGKTHLTNIWHDKTDAKILKEGDDFQKHQNNYSHFIFEDIESLGNEEYLFHLMNFCRNNSFQLLLTSCTIPEFILNDLRSRVNSIHKVIIKNPDDEMVKILLLKHFTDKQLKVSAEVIDFMITRIERSFKSVKQLVSAVDQLSLIEKRNITIPMVKQVIQSDFLIQNLEKTL